MIVEELWTSRDDAALAAFRAALLRSDLAAALFAIDGTPAPVAEADRATMLEWARRIAARLSRMSRGGSGSSGSSSVFTGPPVRA